MAVMSILGTKKKITALLADAGVEEPLREATYLMEAGLGLTRGEMFSLDEWEATTDQITALHDMAQRRAQREPLARILGHKEFWSLNFHLSDDTLVPRPDSETVIEAVLAALPDRTAAHRILDLGTGTGCLLLSLLHEYKQASGVGADLAPGAVLTARGNALSLGLNERAEIIESNWFEKVAGSFDIIVSNPPYIPDGDIDGLMDEVRLHDPLGALAGGPDGLNPYRIIIPTAWSRLNPGGVLAVELGQGQAEQVAELFALQGAAPQIRADLGGIDRVVWAQKQA